MTFIAVSDKGKENTGLEENMTFVDRKFYWGTCWKSKDASYLGTLMYKQSRLGRSSWLRDIRMPHPA